jgi:hypothetical protein
MKPQDELFSQAKTALEIIFVNRFTSLPEEFDKSLGTFCTTFVLASRAKGERLGNLEVLTAGSYHSSAGCGDDDKESHPGKKARTSEETKTLFQRIEQLESLSPTSTGGDNLQMIQVGNKKAVAVVARFETHMNDLEVKLGRVMAKGDKQVIRFTGLGFLKPAQANAWIKAEMPHHPTGAIVDIHIVFEQIHHSMSNVSTLAVMQQLVKIKVQYILDGSAITSYDQKIPKFFSKSSGHKVIKDAASFLDLVPFWTDWEAAQTGFHLCLEEELIAFKQAHSEEIEALQDYSTKAYTVAKLALTALVAWIHGFISFIDTYYRKLNKAKFGLASLTRTIVNSTRPSLDQQKRGTSLHA